MCGIVGYLGNRQAAPILLDGLSKLEYRGYDSAGVCVYSDGELKVAKAKGRLANLSGLIDGGNALKGTFGIGHTRWATHGAPSDINSHPHMADAGKIAVVHNGIIEKTQPTLVVDDLLTRQLLVSLHCRIGVHLEEHGILTDGRNPVVVLILACKYLIAEAIRHLDIDGFIV